MVDVVAEPKTRKARTAASEVQKKATVLRSDAARLERIAMDSTNPAEMLATAAKLRARADALAPAAPKSAKVAGTQCSFSVDGVRCRRLAYGHCNGTCFSHADPLTKLTDTEWQAVEAYFMGGDFRANLLQVTSWRKLKDIATPAPA